MVFDGWFLLIFAVLISTTKKMDTTTSKKTIPKVPEILLKKRKIYADIKAKRLRGQVQANKVIDQSLSFHLESFDQNCFSSQFRIRNTNV